MSVAFYMDEHVPFAITTGLILRGVDVLTVQDDEHQKADDPVLLDRAMALKRIIFTQDEDFLRQAQRRQTAGDAFAGVVYAQFELYFNRTFTWQRYRKTGELKDRLIEIQIH